jgi:hypothetical protein
MAAAIRRPAVNPNPVVPMDLEEADEIPGQPLLQRNHRQAPQYISRLARRSMATRHEIRSRTY